MTARSAHVCVMVIAFVLGACAGDSPLYVPSSSPPARADAGSSASDAAVPVIDGLFREDFGHRGFVESSSVAIIDVNHGWVTLPAQTFPALTEGGVRTLSEALSFNGLVEAGTIVVVGDVTVDATDSIELRASDTVHVSGHIRAGVGGMRIVAGRAVYVDGFIESAGPVRIQLAGSDGEIDISGRIQTLAAESRGSGAISIEARGAVHVSGVLQTGDARYGDSGDISILAYGDVLVDGGDTLLSCGTSVAGRAGSVRITTESGATVTRAGLRGGDGEVASGARTVRAGEVSIRAAEIALLDAANLSGGRSTQGIGGGVSLISAGLLTAGRAVQILGGGGRAGGTLALDARTASVAARLRAGTGDEEAGRVLVSASAAIALEAAAQLAGGDGACAAGGDVVIVAAGPVSVAPSDVELIGGIGGSSVGTQCFGDYAGGSVLAVAHVIHGYLEVAARGGAGTPPGDVSVRLDATFRRGAPSTGTRVDGWVISRPIDRPAGSIGRQPVLAGLRAEVPEGTSARIELSDADAASPLWYPVVVGDVQAAMRLADASRLRYRILLSGRSLDAPVIDGFEIALAGF